jgi:hypothetical protein
MMGKVAVTGLSHGEGFVATSTVIADVAVKPPFTVVTVMVANPSDTAVTTPLLFTVATAVLFELQLTLLLVALLGVTVAVSAVVPPNVVIVADSGDTVTPVTGMVVVGLTVIADVAVKLPSTVVTVMVALPADTAVTTPLLFTVATAVLFELQVTLLLVALFGAIVAVNVVVPPIVVIVAVGGATDTPVTGIGAIDTVITEVAVYPPSTVVTVMVAEPAAIAVTTPVLLTVATVVLPELHVTFLLVALPGATVAVSVVVPPTLVIVAVRGATVTPVTGVIVPVVPYTSNSYNEYPYSVTLAVPYILTYRALTSVNIISSTSPLPPTIAATVDHVVPLDET